MFASPLDSVAVASLPLAPGPPAPVRAERTATVMRTGINAELGLTAERQLIVQFPPVPDSRLAASSSSLNGALSKILTFGTVARFSAWMARLSQPHARPVHHAFGFIGYCQGLFPNSSRLNGNQNRISGRSGLEPPEHGPAQPVAGTTPIETIWWKRM